MAAAVTRAAPITLVSNVVRQASARRRRPVDPGVRRRWNRPARRSRPARRPPPRWRTGRTTSSVTSHSMANDPGPASLAASTSRSWRRASSATDAPRLAEPDGNGAAETARRADDHRSHGCSLFRTSGGDDGESFPAAHGRRPGLDGIVPVDLPRGEPLRTSSRAMRPPAGPAPNRGRSGCRSRRPGGGRCCGGCRTGHRRGTCARRDWPRR
jgi:hypothetical protein